jgi:hypothetical protein
MLTQGCGLIKNICRTGRGAAIGMLDRMRLWDIVGLGHTRIAPDRPAD